MAGVDQLPEAIAADAGYWNEQLMDEVVANKHIPVLVAPDKGNRGTPRPGWRGRRYAWMRTVLGSESGRERYKKRKQTIEPTFGNTKHNKGVIRFHRRGRTKVRPVWQLRMMTENLTKVHRHQIGTVRGPKRPHGGEIRPITRLLPPMLPTPGSQTPARRYRGRSARMVRQGLRDDLDELRAAPRAAGGDEATASPGRAIPR